jgi:cytidylate kinase
MPVVTIRGKLGSWAPEIGRLISQKLRIDYIDREIIAEVCNRLHLQERDVIAKEMPPATLRGRIAEAFARGYPAGVGFEGASLPFWQIPLDDNRYLEALRSLIGELAKNKDMLVYGRGSQFILKDFPHTLHISAVAPLPVRVKRVMESEKIDEAAAKHEISRFDNSAREFIKRFFNAEMEDPIHYDLVLNTQALSQEAAANIAIEALKCK